MTKRTLWRRGWYGGPEGGGDEGGDGAGDRGRFVDGGDTGRSSDPVVGGDQDR